MTLGDNVAHPLTEETRTDAERHRHDIGFRYGDILDTKPAEIEHPGHVRAGRATGPPLAVFVNLIGIAGAQRVEYAAKEPFALPLCLVRLRALRGARRTVCGVAHCLLPARIKGLLPSRTSLVLTIWGFNAHLAKYLGL